jgi:hypothetical protein
VKTRGGSSASVAVTDSSGEGCVEIAGSVPRKIYLNGVFVTVTSTTTREVLYRYISKTRQIPMTEKIPIKAGGIRPRSKTGWLSITNGNCFDSAYSYQMTQKAVSSV